MKNSKIAFIVLVALIAVSAKVWSDNRIVDIRQFNGNLANAVNNSHGKKIVISTPTVTLVSSLVTPTDVQIEVTNGGLIIRGSNTLTINGHFVAGLYTSFSGTGPVVFSNGSIKEALPEWWGAKGDWNTDSTAAINSAVAAFPVVRFSRGVYKLIPATPMSDDSGTTYAAIPMKSNMALIGDDGATLKIADNQSTDGAPKQMDMIYTNQTLSNITIKNLILDMNGQNNTQSPSRPATYNRYEMAQFRAAGDFGRIDDVMIENVQFLNSSGTNCIVSAQTASVGVPLGHRWTVKKCLFKNNGLDTDDHSSVYIWGEDAVVEGNIFTSDATYRTTGKTGATTAFEAHGKNNSFNNNIVRNYGRGAYVAENLTSPTTNVIISKNTMGPLQMYGVEIFRQTAASQLVKNILIDGNTIELDDTTFTGSPGIKSGVRFEPAYAVTDVQISNNIVSKLSGTQVDAALFESISSSVAGQKNSNIVIKNNHVTGTNYGVFAHASSTNNIGHILIANNTFENLSDAFDASYGLMVSYPSSTIENLDIDGNSFIDSRSTPTFKYGIYLNQGNIGTLNLGPQKYSNLVTANYTENSVTIGNRTGFHDKLSFVSSWSSGTNTIVVGNGTIAGEYTIDKNLVFCQAKLTVGSTTSFGTGGTLGVNLPINADVSTAISLGSYRIYDSSAGTWRVGQVEISSNIGYLMVDNGLYASNSSPVPLASGDIIIVQMTYPK